MDERLEADRASGRMGRDGPQPHALERSVAVDEVVLEGRPYMERDQAGQDEASDGVDVARETREPLDRWRAWDRERSHNNRATGEQRHEYAREGHQHNPETASASGA